MAEDGRIIFLGTGGGRFVVITQLRATGGWILEMDNQMLHIDPGPGALVMAKKYRVRLDKLTGILCSHAHPEHYTDLEVVIEAMTRGCTEKKGVLIASEHVLKGEGKYRAVVSPYHQEAVEEVVMLKPGDKTRVGGIQVTATPTRHGDVKGVGFVFKGSHTVGYTSDGEYFKGMEKHYRGCDCLIMNVLRPRGKTWPHHLNTESAAKLVARSKPKLAITQHFGMLALRAGPEKEAAWIQEQTGIKTIAARDGMVIELDRKPGKAPLNDFFK